MEEKPKPRPTPRLMRISPPPPSPRRRLSASSTNRATATGTGAALLPPRPLLLLATTATLCAAFSHVALASEVVTVTAQSAAPPQDQDQDQVGFSSPSMTTPPPPQPRSEPKEEEHLPGFWGKPTSTVNWCETDYEVSMYVAEFFNTVSSLAIIAAGALDLYRVVSNDMEPRFVVESISIMLVGVGSTLFHGTLLFEFQMLDELPMVYTMLVWFYVFLEMPYKKRRYPWLPIMLLLYGVAWSVVHVVLGLVTVFQVHFVMMLLICVAAMIGCVKKHKDPHLNNLARSYVVCLLAAFACWLTDFHLCGEAKNMFGTNLQFHALWHVFVALSCYYSVPLTVYARGIELGTKPKLNDFSVNLLGTLPISLPYVEQYRNRGHADHVYVSIPLLDYNSKSSDILSSYPSVGLGLEATAELFA